MTPPLQWNYEISASLVAFDQEELLFENSCVILSKWRNFLIHYKTKNKNPFQFLRNFFNILTLQMLV